MIYVDKLIWWPQTAAPGAERYFGKGKPSCHLWCDLGEEEQLHELAQSIGLRRSWFQIGAKPWLSHYDLTPSKRALALKVGAKEMSYADWTKKTKPWCGGMTHEVPYLDPESY